MSWSRIKGIYFRYLYAQMKGGNSLADLFYWPLVDILLWGLTSIWIREQHNVANLPLILMTGLIFWQVTWRGSIDISVNLLQEFWNRNLVNLFSTPLKLTEWGIGVILLCLTKLLITVMFGAALVYMLYSLNVFSIGWLFIPFAVSLVIFGWTLGFLAASLIIYWGQQVESFAWMIGFVFAPFSSVFYPVQILPSWVQTISWCLPSTYIFEGMRSILNTGDFPAYYFGMSLAINAAYLLAAFMLFNYMYKKSRSKGLARLG